MDYGSGRCAGLSVLLRGDRLPAYIVHCTTEQTVAEVQRARQAGVQVTSQVGIHYLVLNKDAWRINVPLRDAATHEALWRALASGEIDCIGSDHVAHLRTREAMETGNVWTTISGFPSRVEGLLPMMLSEGVNAGRITLERLAQVASENPARIFGLYPRKGVIQVGADADLVVVDLDREATITASLLHTATPWTIYEGRRVRGWPVMTLLARRGRHGMARRCAKVADRRDAARALPAPPIELADRARMWGGCCGQRSAGANARKVGSRSRYPRPPSGSDCHKTGRASLRRRRGCSRPIL